MVKLMPIKVNDPFKKLNPKFYPVWITKKSDIILTGGRSSTKSSVVSQKLVEKKMRYPMGNAVILRQVANTLRKSVYSQISWALHDAGVANQFVFKANPMEIIHKKWGTGFHFSGADDPEKLKSLIIPVGYVQDLWFEEANSFDGEKALDTIQDTFIRKVLPDGREMQTWYSWNPERNPYHWSNEFAKKHKNNESYLVHHSTYMDDIRGYNSKQILKKIENYKKNDIDYWRWMYKGEVIGMGDNVYNADLFHLIDELPEDEHLYGLYFATDTGHMVSATATIAVGITNKQNIVILDTDYYSPKGKTHKKPPSEMTKDLYDFYEKARNKYSIPIYQKTIDSAEGGIRNQYFNDYGEHIHAVAKGKKVDMIDYVHDLLAQGRVYVLNIPNNKIFMDEHKKYQWDQKTLQPGREPEVIKEDDHTCDCFQYFVKDNLRQLGLKF